MRIIRASDVTTTKAWDALLIARINNATVRLHWTDQPYPWHINDGDEVFAVMDGVVAMHYRAGGEEGVAELQAGDIFFASEGEAHSARPQGQARILVIETAGSP